MAVGNWCSVWPGISKWLWSTPQSCLTQAGAEACGTTPCQFSQDVASFLILAEWGSFRSFHLAISIISFYLLREGILFKKIFIYWVIYLAVPGLCCGTWDLVPWPWIEPVSPALGVWSLNHWTMREVFFLFFFLISLTTWHSMWDLSSPTRDRTCAPCSGRMES